MHWYHKIFTRRRPHIPDSLWTTCVSRLHFVRRLPAADLARLKSLCEDLLARKTFTGVAGQTLSNETTVLIAAQACLPVLNLTLDLYDDMAGIVVYPAAFLISQSEMDEAGVVHEWREAVSGEAIDAGGAVVLSWEDARDTEAPGYNVVIHEFAHKIDMADGMANGCPPFLAGFHRSIDSKAWQREFSSAWKDFLGRTDRLAERLPASFSPENPLHAGIYEDLLAELPLDPYASRHPAEFFAVASEAFFVAPHPLAKDYPGVYRMLALYYRQDPIGA